MGDDAGAGGGGTARFASCSRRRRRRVRACPMVAPRANRPKDAAAVSRLPCFPMVRTLQQAEGGDDGQGAVGGWLSDDDAQIALVTARFVVSLEAEMIGCIPPVVSGHLDANAYATAGNSPNTFYQR